MDRISRIVKTGLAFALFGVGGLVIGILVFPLLLLFAPRRDLSRHSRAVIAWCFRTFMWLVQALNVITFEHKNLSRVTPGTILIANHPSLIDIVLIAGWLPNANCVVKPGLFKNPFLAGPVYAAGYINSQAADLADQISQTLLSGETVIVFPEGTRTVPGQTMKFKRGAAHLALQTDARLQPVSITVSPTTLTKAESWWQVPASNAHFEVTVHEPWPLDRYTDSGLPSQQARHLSKDLQRFLASKVETDVDSTFEDQIASR
jgi:1-acyl-sn-glycerol-3-phosphate acyltransferase